MNRSKIIELEFSKDNLLKLLSDGARSEDFFYSHKQIAEWCERFWNKYMDVDAPSDIEQIMPVLADVETQWDLYLANTYAISELKQVNFESERLPTDWFNKWISVVNA